MATFGLMIVTCPNCRTRYRVRDHQIEDDGRRVRCRACGHSWHQLPVDEPEPLPEPPPKPPKPKRTKPKPPPKPPEPEPDPFWEPAKPQAPLSLDDDPLFGPSVKPAPAPDPLGLDEDPFESRMARRRLALEEGPGLALRKPVIEKKPGTSPLVWLGFIILAAAIGGGGYAFVLFKDVIGMAFPATASVYAALAEWTGMPDLAVNVRGLTFRGVDHTRGYVGSEAYMSVTGQVVNITDSEVEVPPIRVAFHDESKHLLDVQLVRPQADKLGPHLSTKFGARLTKIADKAAFIEVAFARPEDIPKGGMPPAPEKPAAAEEHGEAPKPETPEDAAAHDTMGEPALEKVPGAEPAPAPAQEEHKPH
jgi:predicted Zn finger-like uncharacterized protein